MGNIIAEGGEQFRMPPCWYHLPMAMTLRLSAEDERLLADLAAADNVSKQEATVRAIREVAERRSRVQSVAQASERVRVRYAHVLERLGR